MLMTEQLEYYMQKFKKQFGDAVPLRKLPATATADDVVDAIKICLGRKENILPDIFGYGFQDDDLL